jgi:hypothetical protein
MLRRLLTAVVVLGIAAIAGLAIADAFRSHEEPEGEPAKPAPARRELPTATEELREGGAAGTIYVADTDCRVHSLRLPSLAEPQGATRAPACSFAVTPRGEVLEGDGWYPPRLARAVPEGDLVALRSSDGWALRVEGRAPAWRPDGTLTVIRGGELRAVDEGCDEGDDCTRLLLGARELRAASASPDRPGELTIREAAWLDERRVALVVSFDRPETETERRSASGTAVAWSARSPATARASSTFAPARAAASSQPGSRTARTTCSCSTATAASSRPPTWPATALAGRASASSVPSRFHQTSGGSRSHPGAASTSFAGTGSGRRRSSASD